MWGRWSRAAAHGLLGAGLGDGAVGLPLHLLHGADAAGGARDPGALPGGEAPLRSPPLALSLVVLEKEERVQELATLKRMQIQYGRVQEEALVKRLTESYAKSPAFLSLAIACRAWVIPDHHFIPSDFQFSRFDAWEKFLYGT